MHAVRLLLLLLLCKSSLHLLRLHSLLLDVLLLLHRPLLRQSFSLLLVLHARGRGTIARSTTGFEIRKRNERAGEGLLGYERMCACLLRGPTLQWVDVQEAVREVDESFAVCHFCHHASKR